MATKIMVKLPGQNGYAVRVGEGILSSLGESMRKVEELSARRDALVITDSNIAPLYLSKLKTSLSTAGFKVSDIVVPAGEQSKSVEVLAELWSAMAKLGLDRDCVVVALGGGVIGDLAGFAAASYMRGVPTVQVPTTLLSMVDSSVGGKTAVNLPEGKNLVGAFAQPSFVCADLETLHSLPEREWLSGFGEIAKSAALDSDDFFFWLDDHATDLVAHNTETLAEALQRCIVFKAGIVAHDETEQTGLRECLNYGHTLGHAIELASGLGNYSHGLCVAEGMRFAAMLTRLLADAGTEAAVSDFAQAQGQLLDALGLNKLELALSPDEVLAAMKHDKKRRSGLLRFVLVQDVADWSVRKIDDATVRNALESWLLD